MVGVENPGGSDIHPLSFEEEKESDDVNDSFCSFSSDTCSDFRSLMSSVSDSHHPLSPTTDLRNPADGEFLGDHRGFGNNEYKGELGNSSEIVESSSSSLANSDSLVTEYLRITVTDPRKEQDVTNSLVPGGNAYISYLITTRTNLQEFGRSEFTVRRRFRDVVTLADRLAESYRGFFIPPRPDKNAVESKVMDKQEFVRERMVALEKYLCRLAAHPAIRRSEEFRLFLQVHGRLPWARSTDLPSRVLEVAVKLPKQLFGESVTTVSAGNVSRPAKGGWGLLRTFKELKQSVFNDLGGAKPPVVEEDKEFLERKGKLMNFEQHLINASKQAERLVKAQQRIGETLGDFGLQFIKLSKFEMEKAILSSRRRWAADCRLFATVAIKASRFYRESNGHSIKHLDKFHEYLGLMQAAHSAFSDRSRALLTAQTLTSELSSLCSRAEKLEASGTQDSKLEELKVAIKISEESNHVALIEYERIKENNKTELERFERERADDLSAMLRGLVVNQVVNAEKIASTWREVVEGTSGYAKTS